MNSNSSSRSSPSRPISDIISALKSSFRETDFRQAIKDLEFRESKLIKEKVENWREKHRILEGDYRQLQIKAVELEHELHCVRRECEISANLLSDSTRDLSVVKEREEKAIKRYDRLIIDFRETERHKVKLNEQLDELRDDNKCKDERIKELVKILEEERRIARDDNSEQKVEELMRKIRVLEMENSELLKSNEVLERGKDEAIVRYKEMMDKICVLEMEKSELLESNAGFERGIYEANARCEEMIEKNRVLEDQVVELKRENESLEEEEMRIVREKRETIEELMKKIRVLEMENSELSKSNAGFERDKREVRARHEEMIRDLEDQVKELGRENENIQELTKKNEEMVTKIRCLEAEKREMSEKNEELIKYKKEAMAKNEQMEKQVMKLEEDVVGLLPLNVARDRNSANTHLEKILSGIFEAIGSGETSNGTMNKGGVPHVNKLQWHQNHDVKLEETVKRKSDFCREVKKVTQVTCFNKAASSSLIVLSDSDNDDEAATPTNVVSKRKWCDDGSSGDHLNPNHRARKLSDLSDELVKHTSSVFTSKSGNQFATPQRQTAAAIRKCNEMPDAKVKESLSLSFFDVDNIHNDDRGLICSPQAKELIAVCRRSRVQQ